MDWILKNADGIIDDEIPTASMFALTSFGTTCDRNLVTSLNGEKMTSRLKNSQIDLFNTPAKPFLKWAGGKSQLIQDIVLKLPSKYRTSRKIPVYIEPFIGGGALFFYLQSTFIIEKSYIADINPDLILTYLVVQKDVDSLIKRLSVMELEYHEAETHERTSLYYSVRDSFNNRKRELNSNP